MTMFTGGLDAMRPNYQTSLLDEEIGNKFWRAAHNWNYRRRLNALRMDTASWSSLWPSSQTMSGDPTVPLGMLGSDIANASAYGAWEITGRGTPSQKFIIGTCKDNVGGTVSGAIVQGFVTATEAYVGQTTADSNGRYELGTPNPGAAHYLVAYRAGAPDIAGTTVNTLTPTNRDGT